MAIGAKSFLTWIPEYSFIISSSCSPVTINKDTGFVQTKKLCKKPAVSLVYFLVDKKLKNELIFFLKSIDSLKQMEMCNLLHSFQEDCSLVSRDHKLNANCVLALNLQSVSVFNRDYLCQL